MRPTLLIAVLFAALGGSAGAAGAATAHGSSGAPVIHEHFTVLPCVGIPNHRTTQELEGCAEHAVLRSDATIDGLAKTIHAKLPNAGRIDFSTASSDWLNYRNALCAAAASPEGRGTEAPIVDAECLETQDGMHISALRSLLQDAFPSLVGERAAAR